MRNRVKNKKTPKVSSEVNHDLKMKQDSIPMHFEFGGPLGAIGIVFGLPLVVYMLYFLCNDTICMKNPFAFDWNQLMGINIGNIITIDAIYMYLTWMIFHIIMERCLPGDVVEGVALPNKSGSKLHYKINGHLQFWLTLFAMGHLIPLIDTSSASVHIKRFIPLLPVTAIYDQYLPLITVSTIGSLLLSVYLYVASFAPEALLATGGNTGYHIYDFFIGRELNPRIGTFDLKEFCELRPGLIGWLAINIGMAFEQHRRLGYISGSMLIVVLSQGVYVWDALFQEKAILTTMDITTDGFGFMLAFGDLTWVPFIYTLQARYLVDHDPDMSRPALFAVLCIQLLGFYVFRAANSEKDAFRRDPDAAHVKHLRYMDTKRGTRLLVSGWWGSARKINYTGDWLVTLSWCLLCGFESPLPYFQALYFAVLLVHRANRDDQMCFDKYGDDWTEYKRRVPYIFIPYVL